MTESRRAVEPQIVFPARFVYLAGPILGCDFGEANDWRHHAAGHLRKHGIIGISPLRCEPLHGERYSAEYPDHKFGVPRAISAKNKFDVRTCDVTLALLPLPAPGRHQSYGTLQEVAWADEANRMTMIVTDDPGVASHPVIDSARGWKFVAPTPDYKSIQDALTDALETCVGLLGGYTGGKNV